MTEPQPATRRAIRAAAPAAAGPSSRAGRNLPVAIASGVVLGAGSAVGANAVVTKDVPENSIAVGIPAKVRPRKTDECVKLVDPDSYVDPGSYII